VLTEFDQNTIANMTAALEQVCKRIPPDKDGYEIRKRIADAMIACGNAGRRTLVDFQDAGTRSWTRSSNRRGLTGSASSARGGSDRQEFRRVLLSHWQVSKKSDFSVVVAVTRSPARNIEIY
jgi:hypothetical protein